MARSKVKISEARSFRIRKDLCDRLDDYSDVSMIPKTALVEKALEEYLDKVAPVEEGYENSYVSPIVAEQEHYQAPAAIRRPASVSTGNLQALMNNSQH